MPHTNDNLPMPEGVGIYMRSISKAKHGTPKEAAKKAKDHGVSFVAIMACWQDIHDGKFRQLDTNRKRDAIQRYSEAFLKEGIDPWIWGYPWAGHYNEFLESMQEAHIPDVTKGWIYDPELGSKWKKPKNIRTMGRTMREGQSEAFDGVDPDGNKKLRVRQADDLMIKTLNNYLPKGCGYITTSYGVARYHSNFPWKQFMMFGAISPQLYKESLKQIERALDEWLAYWEQATGLPVEQAVILPSVAAYGEKAQLNMRRYLASFLLCKHPIHGILVWSWRQIDAREWDELARFAGDLEEGATRLVV